MTQPRRTNQELIEGLLRIRSKRGQTVRFRLNDSQRLYMSRRTRRNLILKGRQQGMSKVIDADQLIDCVRKPTNAVVISHERESTERLFDSVRFFIDTLPVKPDIQIDSKRRITFPKRGSSYFVGTAGQRATGRGDTVDRAHLSEAAFYIDLTRTLAGISEAAEYGQIDIETTPNGREAFYGMWQAAKAGRSAYTPIFIPWFINREYDADLMLPSERAGLSAAVREMFDTPAEEWQWTEDEKALAARVRQEYGFELTVGQIKWRRYKIWDKGELFFQEYPEDDESCFLQSGRAVFRQITVDESRRVPLDDIGRMRPEDVERLRNGRKLLYGGLDAAEGTETGDAHSFAVLEPFTDTGKADVIFDLTSNEPIDTFAVKVAEVCDAFNIQLGVEKNGVGLAMCRKLDDLGVAFDEWTTTATTRPVMIAELEAAYRKQELVESYREAEAQARAMVYDESNRPSHPSGQHDDRVFARAIAYQQLKAPVPSIEFF
jgi:hypothetical protein